MKSFNVKHSLLGMLESVESLSLVSL